MNIPKRLWWILGLALLLRLVLFLALDSAGRPDFFVLGDTGNYTQLAHNMLAGNGYSMATSSPYAPDSIRTPLLPLMIAASESVTGSDLPVIWLQIVLSLVLILFTYKIAYMVGSDERIALVAAALMAFEPYSIFINFSILTETLFATINTLAIYCVFRYVTERSVVALCAASALCALAALTRPIAEFTPALLILVVLLVESPRAYLKYVAAAIIPFLIISSPWLIRNDRIFGVVSFSSGGLQNVYSDLGATIISYRDGVAWRSAKDALEADFAKRHNIPLDTIQQNLSLSPTLFREGLAIMIDNPGATVKSFVSVAIAFFTNDAWTYYLEHWNLVHSFDYTFSPTHMLITEGPIATFERVVSETGPVLIVPLVGRLFWVIVSALFFVGSIVLVIRGGTQRIFALVMLLSVLYYLGLSWSAGAGVNGRYRYPINPLIFTGAVVGGAYLIARLRRMIQRSS